MTAPPDTGHVQISARHTAPLYATSRPVPKELSVLVYLDGESADLSREASDALLNLELAGSDQTMHVVAQLGRSQPGIDGAWTGIRRYEVQHDDHAELRVTSEQWSQVVSHLPDNPVALHSLARALSQEGKGEEASTVLAEAKRAGYLEFLQNPNGKDALGWKSEFLSAREELLDAPEWKLSSPVVGEVEGSMQDPRTLEDFLAWGMKTYPAKRHVVVMMGHGYGPFGVQGHNPTDLSMVLDRAAAQAGVARPETVALLACQTASLEGLYTLRNSADFLVAPQHPMLAGAANRLGPYLANLSQQLEQGEVKGEALARGMVEALSQGPGALAGLTAVRTSELAGVVQAVESCQPQPGVGLLDLEGLRDEGVAKAAQRAVLAHQGPGSGLTLWSPEEVSDIGHYRYSSEAFAADSTWDEKLLSPRK